MAAKKSLEKRYSPPPAFSIPIFDSSASRSDLLTYFQRNQILHYRPSCSLDESFDSSNPLKGLQAIWEENKDAIKSHWSVENEGEASETVLSDAGFLMNKTDRDKLGKFYVSCILQDDIRTIDHFLRFVPFSIPPFVDHGNGQKCNSNDENSNILWKGFKQTHPLWLFIGRLFVYFLLILSFKENLRKVCIINLRQKCPKSEVQWQ